MPEYGERARRGRQRVVLAARLLAVTLLYAVVSVAVPAAAGPMAPAALVGCAGALLLSRLHR